MCLETVNGTVNILHYGKIRIALGFGCSFFQQHSGVKV